MGKHLISIHAPRVGSDLAQKRHGDQHADFNPRSPCGERPIFTIPCLQILVFQSTLPVWGATNISEVTNVSQAISIHAPRVGSDILVAIAFRSIFLFQSTLPVWGATLRRYKAQTPPTISIHAPRVGSDRLRRVGPSLSIDFNPRSPCGERLWNKVNSGSAALFQSTLPVWGATRYQHKFQPCK